MKKLMVMLLAAGAFAIGSLAPTAAVAQYENPKPAEATKAEAAATAADDHVIERQAAFGRLLGDLEARRALSCDDVRVVVRWHQRRAAFVAAVNSPSAVSWRASAIVPAEMVKTSAAAVRGPTPDNARSG